MDVKGKLGAYVAAEIVLGSDVHLGFTNSGRIDWHQNHFP